MPRSTQSGFDAASKKPRTQRFSDTPLDPDGGLRSRITRLYAVTAALGRALSPSEVAHVILDAGIPAAGAYAGSVFAVTPGADALVLVEAMGYPEDRVRGFHRVPMDSRLPACDAITCGEPVFIETTDDWNARYLRFPDDLERGNAWAALPLHGRDGALGVFTLTFREAAPFSLDDREFMIALAGQCAQALDRARLFAEMEAARGEAERANRTKAEFLATMSHELRTPLTAIRGFTELMLDEIVGPINETQRDQLERIDGASEHLLLLVEDVLRYTRLAVDGEHVHVRAATLGAICTSALDLVGPLAAKKGLMLELVIVGGETVLETDDVKLRQIVANLLANAVKFSDAGRIVLDARFDGASAVLGVTDTGPGIPDAFLECIFDPFLQVDQSFTRKAGGSGLGLSIARKLARLLGGDVAATSSVGRGSTFTVRIPRSL